MTTRPISASRYLEIMRAEGLDVSGYGNWRTHGRQEATGKTFGPVNGVVIHHTAGRNSLALCYNGITGLPGPLCHNHLAKNGHHSILSVERANHAGTFAANAHQAVLNESPVHPRPSSSEPIDGNDHYYGLEIENLGDNVDFYPWVQYVAAVKWATAICREQGWNQDSVIGHKEGTTRKIDPRGPVRTPDGGTFQFTMERFRRDVKAALSLSAGRWQGSTQEEDVALTPEDIEKIFTADIIPAAQPPYENSDLHQGNERWTFTYAMYTVVMHAREAAERAEALQGEVNELEAKLDNIAVGGVDLEALAVKVADKLAERLAS